MTIPHLREDTDSRSISIEDNNRLIQITKGRFNTHPTAGRPRGGIDSLQMHQIKQLFSSDPTDVTVHEGLLLTWLASLRHGQLKSLKPEQIVEDEGFWYILTPESKGSRQFTKDSRYAYELLAACRRPPSCRNTLISPSDVAFSRSGTKLWLARR